jgi:hypothetical protein
MKQDHAYVIASTLNQMVNLIPMVIDFKNVKIGTIIYNITLVDEAGEKLPENQKWDKNLAACVNKLFPGKYSIKDIPIRTNLLLNAKELGEEITNQLTNETNPLFWNITGGQRHYLFSVNQVINKRESKVFYLDGNYGKIYWIHGHNIMDNYSINSKDINILQALQLMGFDMSGYNSGPSDESSKGLELWQRYKTDEDLRKTLISSNKGSKDLSAVYAVLGDDANLIDFVQKYKDKSYPFGYLLEEMVVNTLSRTLEKEILEIAHSTKLRHESSPKIIDEFDILLLTKTGQLINFECKSGFMDGDVAKSTRYSTYAIGGVYGLPILITPLTQIQCDKFESLPDDVYHSIKASIRAAKRAQLDVWGIDKITERTESKLKSTR